MLRQTLSVHIWIMQIRLPQIYGKQFLNKICLPQICRKPHLHGKSLPEVVCRKLAANFAANLPKGLPKAPFFGKGLQEEQLILTCTIA